MVCFRHIHSYLKRSEEKRADSYEQESSGGLDTLFCDYARGSHYHSGLFGISGPKQISGRKKLGVMVLKRNSGASLLQWN